MIRHPLLRVWLKPGTFLLSQLLTLIINCCFGQTSFSLKGTVINSKTKLGIPYVSIGIDNTTIGVISNENGEFRLVIPTEYRKSRLSASSIGYKTTYLSLNDSLFLLPVKIAVDEEATILKEIAVTAKGETPLQVLKEAAAITNEKSYSPSILHTYYREFLKKNSTYTEYADALIDYYLPPPERWQSRSAIQVKVKESRSKTVNMAVDTGLDLNLRQIINLKILPSYCNPDRIVRYFTNTGAEKNYIFSISEDTAQGLYVVSIDPRREVRKKLYSGRVYIDKASMIIRHAEIEIPSSHLPYTEENILVIRMKMEKFKLTIQYQISEEKCFIKHMRADLTLRTFNKKSTNVAHSFVSEFVINKIDFKNVSPFKKDELYKKNSLQKSKTKFQNEFWANQNGLVATHEEDSVINNLDNRPGN